MSDSEDFRCNAHHVKNRQGTYTYECPLTRYNRLQRKFKSPAPIRSQEDFDKFRMMLISPEDYARIVEEFADMDPNHLEVPEGWGEPEFALGTVTYSDMLGGLEFFEGVGSHEGTTNIIDMGS